MFFLYLFDAFYTLELNFDLRLNSIKLFHLLIHKGDRKTNFYSELLQYAGKKACL